MLDAEEKHKAGNATGGMGLTIFNTMFKNGLTEKEHSGKT